MITQRLHVVFEVRCGPYMLAQLVVTAVTPAEALRALAPVLEAAALASERLGDTNLHNGDFRIVIHSDQWRVA